MTIVNDALEWCNDRRAEKGQEPLDSLPKGITHDPGSCPCGRATGLWVDHTTYAATRHEWENNLGVEQLPDVIKDFVAEFDKGAFPELIDVGDDD